MRGFITREPVGKFRFLVTHEATAVAAVRALPFLATQIS